MAVGFKGIFEIAPTDTFKGRSSITPFNTAWNVLVGYCDGDLAFLSGIQPYDRMMLQSEESIPSPKSKMGVVGANHNFFNTEWQTSDTLSAFPATTDKIYTRECDGQIPLFGVDDMGSVKQQLITQAAVLAFFRAHLLGDSGKANLFNPLFAMPPVVKSITVERAFTHSVDIESTLIVENFQRETGINSYSGLPNRIVGVEMVHMSMIDASRLTLTGPYVTDKNETVTVVLFDASEHDAGFWGGRVTFSGIGNIEFKLAEGSGGLDVSSYQTLDFDIARADFRSNRVYESTDFTVRLIWGGKPQVWRDVKLSTYLNLTGLYGWPIPSYPGIHTLMPTARIPLDAFGPPSTMRSLAGINFIFDQTPAGSIYLGNIRFSKRSDTTTYSQSRDDTSDAQSAISESESSGTTSLLSVEECLESEECLWERYAIKKPPTLQVRLEEEEEEEKQLPTFALHTTAHGDVKIEVNWNKPFLIGDDEWKLKIGEVELDSAESGLNDDGEITSLIFSLSQEQLLAISTGTPLHLAYGPASVLLGHI